jgi:Reverse transcriptase (RNA-dependent DNA polymerase).
MQRYGYSANVLRWVENYLENRQQQVLINNNLSKPATITCGVPQGSILGPLLFLIYINDLPNATNFKVTMFADDTTLQHFGNNLQVMEVEASHSLKNLASWLKVNKLVLNLDKTKMLVFSPRNVIRDFRLELNGRTVQQVGPNNV